MVIGNGLIAHKFSSYNTDQSKIIFASGVSNSNNTDKEKFNREFKLLQYTVNSHPGKTIVYFSTCSIDDYDLTNSPYVIHKIDMEDFIKKNASTYLIFRISNIAGISNNPYTLLNYFIFNILQNHPLEIWKNASRNLIGIDDVFTIADYILLENKVWNSTINIANSENYTIPYIISQIELHFGKKAVYEEIDRGCNYKIDISLIEPLIKKLNIKFDDDYLRELLRQYYHSK